MPTYAGIRASDGDVSLTFGRSWAAHSACRAGLKLIWRRRAAQNAKEAWAKLLAAMPSCANRRFAGTTEAGHFAQTGPVRVLELLVRARPVPVNFAPAGLSFGDCARAASLPVHYGGRGRVGAFAWA